jgi:hypothetical protein
VVRKTELEHQAAQTGIDPKNQANQLAKARRPQKFTSWRNFCLTSDGYVHRHMTRKTEMQTRQLGFIDTIIDPIPFFGPVLADLLHTWSGVAEAMNLRNLVEIEQPAPPGDNVVVLETPQPVEAIRKAA